MMKNNIQLQEANYELVQQIKQLLKEHFEPLQKVETESNKEILTRAETIEYLKISYPTLNKWAKDGRLIPTRIGGRVYYKKSEILDSLS